MTQGEALAILKTGLNVFLTGEPGSGKTHTINAYVAWLSERGVEAAVTASTGIAATHINGMTIHSWSGIGVKRHISDYDIEIIQSREKTAKRIINAKVLIIDEISMLDSETLESVDRVLRTLRHRPLMPEEPFGGLQIIFVGDFFQLPPVTKEDKVMRFSFESQAWKEANPVICYLNEQHRQDDREFLELLKAMRHVGLDAKHRARLRSRVGIMPEDNGATRLYTHNADVDRINGEALTKISGSAHVYQMTSRGASSLVEALKKNCLSPETLVLKEGAMVMFTRNNFDAGYVNGTLGTVTGFSPLGAPIVKTKSGMTLAVEPAEWAIQDGAKIIAKINQVPLRLAWAITVHKSQGMSLDSAVIDLGAAFEYGQGYVAISRVRNLNGLFLKGFNERALEMHPKIVAQDSYFRAYSDAARKKFASLPQLEKEKLEKNFLRAIGAKEPKPAESAAGASERFRNSLRSNSPHSSSAPAADSADSRAALREKYPNMGKPWKQEHDHELTQLFKDGRKNSDIAKHFGRKPSAITARLGHLGLIDDGYFVHKKKLAE
ncbi:MAG TPA: PIF1 family DEAD/DEAH box helicase [Candidatus Paceibacterota bacterium]|nr:PIF1 family DEAD/DEAH box helicase [Candidatus Paceibacterota bacterium]